MDCISAIDLEVARYFLSACIKRKKTYAAYISLYVPFEDMLLVIDSYINAIITILL